MPSSADARIALTAVLLLAGCGAGEMPPPATSVPPVAAATDVGPDAAPGGRSDEGVRYDEVGHASWYGEEAQGSTTASGAPFRPDAITAAHRTLPLGSYAEVTSLDTGRTIVVLVNDRGPARDDRLIDLSRGAAALLGTAGQAVTPVRVRSARVSPADATALARGEAAEPRLDTPPAVLAALRKRVSTLRATRPRTPRPARAAPPPLDAGAYLVQVAAFSNRARAQALADTLGGRVESDGGLHRVRLGPFADPASAARARDAAGKRGYGDATIIVQP